MSELKQLFGEAERIRTRYQSTSNDDERAQLQRRYDDIDAQIRKIQESPEQHSPEKPAKKVRLSITKKQSKDAVAVDLLTIVDSITTDGAVSDTEIGELKAWLDRNQDSPLPAVAFLSDVISMILEDGLITAEERKQVYKAVETILPSDLRKYASQKRKIAEALDKEKARAAQKEAKQQERQRLALERERNAPLLDADFMVAGVKYDGRDRVVRRYVRANDEVLLVRDAGNKYSSNAIQIHTMNARQIGFVPEDWAEDIAPLLDEGCLFKARVKKVLTGGQVHIPVVVAEIYGRDTGETGVREARQYAGNAGGCLGALVLLGTIAFYLASLA